MISQFVKRTCSRRLARNSCSQCTTLGWLRLLECCTTSLVATPRLIMPSNRAVYGTRIIIAVLRWKIGILCESRWRRPMMSASFGTASKTAAKLSNNSCRIKRLILRKIVLKSHKSLKDFFTHLNFISSWHAAAKAMAISKLFHSLSGFVTRSQWFKLIRHIMQYSIISLLGNTDSFIFKQHSQSLYKAFLSKSFVMMFKSIIVFKSFNWVLVK